MLIRCEGRIERAFERDRRLWMVIGSGIDDVSIHFDRVFFKQFPLGGNSSQGYLSSSVLFIKMNRKCVTFFSFIFIFV